MNKINVLDKSVFNRIAAGEVVERPSSIVKELVENALDAGARRITVTVEQGGVKLVRVSDDGCGIPRDGVKTAFLPHATSKIASVGDLDAISTLGFRGEALPSIASVATVTMVTRTADSDIGTRYVVDNGAEIDFGDAGAPFGTSVTVERLFERIPARRKFLQKDVVEENAIAACVQKFILANPDVSFEYFANGKLVRSSSGDGVESAITTVYGIEYLENSSYIKSESSGIVLCGYVNKPAYTKHSKAFQTLVVNGRYVQSEEIAFTVYGCYQKYLMKRQYPTYVLYLNLPCDLVDVNVHPSKTEVRFAAAGLIKKIVADAIKNQVLADVALPKEISSPSRDEEMFKFFTAREDEEDREKTAENGEVSGEKVTKKPAFGFEKIKSAADNFVSSEPSPSKRVAVEPDFDDVFSLKSTSFIGEKSAPAAAKSFDGFSDVAATSRAETLSDVIGAIDSGSYSPIENAEQTEIKVETPSRIIGKLFNTYIVIERGESVYLIDQHAAHEKLLFDRLTRQYEGGVVAVQKLLVPYAFSVDPSEVDVLLGNIDELNKAGFVVRRKNSTLFELSGVPACCSSINVRSFVSDFVSEMPFASGDLIASIMQSACKAAIKGEDDLSEIEIKSLLEDVMRETSELFCPHGRPVSVKLTRSEIEKWFKRLV